jgi:hypothetical protein
LSGAPRSAYDAMRLPPDITAVINDFHIGKSLDADQHVLGVRMARAKQI